MHVKAIRKQRHYYAVLLVVSILLALYCTIKPAVVLAVVFAVAAFASLMLLIRQNRLLFDAGLIWDNRIFTVPAVIVYRSGVKEKEEAEETIVSTFGLLIGSKMYKWGSEGIHGVRLLTIAIDRTWLHLTFGDGDKNMRVELLHGLADKQKAEEVQQKFWRETGITAALNGW